MTCYGMGLLELVVNSPAFQDMVLGDISRFRMRTMMNMYLIKLT